MTLIGTLEHQQVGYSFVLTEPDATTESSWFFWRDEYELEQVSTSFAEWLDAFLGFSVRAAIERGAA